MEYFREMLGLVQQNLSRILSMANLTITWVDIVEILIISFLVYHVLLWIKSMPHSPSTRKCDLIWR